MVKYAMKGKAKKSKRVTLQQKYKIERKVQEHHKKARRTAKKMQAQGLKKKAKLDVIPNLYPFKANLINQQEDERARHLVQTREKRKSVHNKQIEIEQAPLILQELSTKRYQDYTALFDVVDVVVEVLDARDPQACRNQDIQREVVAAGKLLVLMITKVDLVPEQEVTKWKHHLEKSHPTVLFSGTKPSISQISSLAELVKAKLHAKESITIGLIGYGLMGKTSVVKSLIENTHFVRERTEKSKPNSVQIGSTVYIHDTTADISCTLPGSLLFNSNLDHKQLIAIIMKQVDKEHLMDLYKIPTFKKSQDFLQKVAKSMGKLLKGGVSNLHAAAKQVIKDLRSNNINFYSTVDRHL